MRTVTRDNILSLSSSLSLSLSYLVHHRRHMRNNILSSSSSSKTTTTTLIVSAPGCKCHERQYSVIIIIHREHYHLDRLGALVRICHEEQYSVIVIIMKDHHNHLDRVGARVRICHERCCKTRAAAEPTGRSMNFGSPLAGTL